jgi:hypothetical protein
MYSNKNTKKSNKKYVILTVIILALVAFAIVWFLLFRNESEPENSTENTDSSSEINLQPPTDQELQAGDEIKEKQPPANNDEPEENPESTNQKQDVDVIITDASQYDDVIEVRAYMPGIFEKGTCSVTMKNGNETFTIDETAFPDASSTICTNQEIKVSDLPSKGSWTVEVSFSSEKYQGTSDQKEVVVQ